jgi:hypothetical protein
MRGFWLGGLAVAAVCTILACASEVGAAARARSPTLDTSTRALYVRAWHECLGQFSGYRGPAGSNIALPAFESCFHQKTGRYPFQLGRP